MREQLDLAAAPASRRRPRFSGFPPWQSGGEARKPWAPAGHERPAWEAASISMLVDARGEGRAA